MLTVYNPATEAFEARAGFDANKLSQQALMLNILIELKVLTSLLADVNGVTDDLQKMRQDFISDVRAETL